MTEAKIDGAIRELTVRRVENGWAIGVHSYNREVPQMWIARTPKELAELMAAWACIQQDG